MSRSPLSYPLNRAADTDVGGAADLQTDVMRFMAILSLCLVAIFALVQSIPLAPVEPQPQTERVEDGSAATEPESVGGGLPATEHEPVGASLPATGPADDVIVLTRPKWVPKFQPAQPEQAPETAAAVASPPLPPPPVPEKEGFVLRFASDVALTRAVASQHVGFYAIHDGRAQRMTVSESRISFWDASTPNTFHEMEATTVPKPVIDALARTGTTVGTVNWGVTLPGKMKAQLDNLMQEHRGGSLVIGAAGDIHWESL